MLHQTVPSFSIAETLQEGLIHTPEAQDNSKNRAEAGGKPLVQLRACLFEAREVPMLNVNKMGFLQKMIYGSVTF